MKLIEKLLAEHPELVRLQDELTEWQKDFEALVKERDALQAELEHLRIALAEDAP